ncbi:MAG TPA: endonuclease V [Oceanithermus profundus]|uniref:Endonuclease V n=1 Tax=Oceanithermus profundus TaxID=187137 RepID=A0A7C4ZQN0_9DEIN|nr:endonuclease V [Oceanithermus profundus]
MKFPPFPKPRDLAAAGALQRELVAQVELAGDWSGMRSLVALDASIRRGGALVAAAVLWDVAAARVRAIGIARVPADEVFPYVPGYLSFREAPVYLAALEALGVDPDALLVDGQGIAHPRGLGIAAHLGVHTGLSSLGVAKSRLFGEAVGALAEAAGSAVPLCAEEAALGAPCPGAAGRQVGWVVRTRARVKPVYVSPGHRIGMDGALAAVLALPRRTKLPEPLRQAHLWAGRARREGLVGRFVIE